jgi:hypothetical protein
LRPPSLRVVIAAVTAGALLGGVAAVHALDVHVTIVQASERGPSDARLLELRPRLRRLVGYRSFRVLHEERRRCAWRSRHAFALPGGARLDVVPKGMRDQEVSMQVQLVEGRRPLVDTDVRLRNRGLMLFGVDQDGRATGGALLIMLKAEE